MMKKLTVVCIALLLVNQAFSQIKEKKARKFASSITIEDLKEHVYLLASDSLQGRDTGMKGQKMAADYIKNHFQELGLQGPVNGDNEYYQQFSLYTVQRGEANLSHDGEALENYNTVAYWSSEPFMEKKLELNYIGKGGELDLDEFEVKDKFVLFKANGRFSPVVEDLKAAGAKGVVVMASDSAQMSLIQRYAKYYASHGSVTTEKPAEDGFGTFVVYQETMEDWFDKPLAEIEVGSSIEVTANAEVKVDEMVTENVLGYLEGTDKKEELIIITAHYDHVGVEGEDIYNGADDDASGTSAVLELAEAFKMAKDKGKGPRRSILFMPVTGEEKGLLGSAHYAANPVFPLENTVANLNIDMIGRVDSAHEENREFVYLIGSNRISTELHEISEMVNEHYTQLSLDYTYNAEDHPDRIYYRSDHWNFAKNGIPIIFYFNGTHDDYHQPTDTPDKIEFDLLKKRAELVFYTAWEIANKDERLEIDVEQ